MNITKPTRFGNNPSKKSLFIWKTKNMEDTKQIYDGHLILIDYILFFSIYIIFYYRGNK